MPMTPETPGQLYDFLAERFGVGDYDESSGQLHWQFRVGEITKLKAMMRKRRTSVDELYMAAEYALANKISIRIPFDLLRLIAPAKRAARTPRHADAAAALITAVQEATRLGMTDWASRLYATAPSAATDVLAEFEQAKKEIR